MFIGISTTRYLVRTVNRNPITREFVLYGDIVRVVGDHSVDR